MVNIIAAIQKKDRGLGYQNSLLFRLKDDLQNFKKLTLGNVVIMGRKTFESLGRPLSNRTNFVITKNKNFRAEGVEIFHSLDEAMEKAKIYNKEIFIIGGGEIYEQALSKTNRLYLTIVEGDKKADTFFPDYSDFKKIISTENKTDPKTGLFYKMLILERD